MTIPNFITIGRLVLVPVIVWLILSGRSGWAFSVFILAGVSDAIDGFLARQLDVRTALGGYLDPLADKALLVSIYVALTFLGHMPVWVTILVVSRDVFIIGGVILSWMLDQPIAMRPHAISKINTLAQILLAAFVLGDLTFAADFGTVTTVLIVAVGILTVASAGIYLVDWVRHMGVGGKPVKPS